MLVEGWHTPDGAPHLLPFGSHLTSYEGSQYFEMNFSVKFVQSSEYLFVCVTLVTFNGTIKTLLRSLIS